MYSTTVVFSELIKKIDLRSKDMNLFLHKYLCYYYYKKQNAKVFLITVMIQ